MGGVLIPFAQGGDYLLDRKVFGVLTGRSAFYELDHAAITLPYGESTRRVLGPYTTRTGL